MIKLGTKKTISIKIIKYFGNYLLKKCMQVNIAYKSKCRPRGVPGAASVLIS